MSSTPNVIILFADDMGYGDLSCYGHPTIQTPNLDGLADAGIRFTSFYVPTPVCGPSRSALLTGRYPPRCGMPGNIGPDTQYGLPLGEITMANILKQEGYQTMHIGKWHLGHFKPEYMPTSRGFDHYFGLLYSNDMIKPWVQTDTPLRLMKDTVALEDTVIQEFLTVRYTEQAMNFIETNKDDPFFLYLAYSMPHLPVNTAPEFKGKSRSGLYGDVIQTIDWSAGQIVGKLKELNLDKNTLVVFTSDNGPWLYLPDRMLQGGNEPWHVGSPGPLRGAKGTTYEGGNRVPGIMSWPGRIPPGQVIADPASTVDLFPTIVAATGAQMPGDRIYDGRNILGAITGEKDFPEFEFFYFRDKRIEGVRHGEWKLRLSRHLRTDLDETDPLTPELFNLDLDPSERYNVANRHPKKVEEMLQKMQRIAAEMDSQVGD
ncbi:MAG: sulfatase [Bacteroidales bacterium]|nr:sulfatase [Bacteroidales bacterium]